MEINTNLKVISATPVGGAAGTNSKVDGKPSAQQIPAPMDLPLEKMQKTLRAMPEVDLEKVVEIKRALARGEVSLDLAALATAILAFHRGGER